MFGAAWFYAAGYGETDLSGGGFGLTFNSKTASGTRGEHGARDDDLTSLNQMPLLLRARVAWAHDAVSDASLGAVFQARRRCLGSQQPPPLSK